ncbi:MAG: PAS domain-containing protein [Rhizobacter sp.]|nr:PAS domain-containing protein [Rhizobacter sp.]
MSHEPAFDPTPAPSVAVLAAWLGQSHDLLALTDASGNIAWANAHFVRSTGVGAGGCILDLVVCSADGDTRLRMQALLRAAAPSACELCLRGASGEPLWLNVRVSALSGQHLWTMQDETARHELEARARRQSEMLEVAQEFGRLGLWEREIPSGEGRWDRHVFNIWGIEPREGTPTFDEAAQRIHPDDHLRSMYLGSTRTAGRYAQRYRVIRPDGSVRWIHSQWEVKNGANGQPDRAIGAVMDDTEAYELALSLDTASAQLKLAAELAHIVLWRHDLKSDRLFYNDQGFKVLGMPFRAEGLSLDEARSYTHPEDVPKVVASAAQALETGEPVDINTRHRRADGSWREVMVRRVVELNAKGEPVAFVGVSLDITDQIENSRRSEQLAQRLEGAAEAGRMGIWSSLSGAEGTEWNAQMHELFELAGQTPPRSLAEALRRCVHPDDAARVERMARDYLRGNPAGFEIEFRTLRSDGSVRWIMLRADVGHGASDGKRMFGIAMDVTDRHLALEALHAASERAAFIARSAGIGTWEAGHSGGPAHWDAQMFRLRGLEPRPAAMNREERLALLHPDDRIRLHDWHSDMSSSPQLNSYEFRVRLPDGSYRWLASRSAVLRVDHGTELRRVGVNWDITEAKSAALARQQADLAERESRAKSQFLSRMSHELRTPLNAVLGFTQLLQLEAQASWSDDSVGKLDHIRAAGEHLLALIDDVLDLSSLEAGMLRLDSRPVDVAAVVASTLPMAEALAAKHRVRLRLGDLPGAALADPARLRQVLLNLLANAIKYNRPLGEVVIESQVVGEHVQLRVHDTGRGMRPEQLAHLFEPFNRLGIESEGIEGTGIGLTIARALVEGMGGSIAAISETGHGTVFELSLIAHTEATSANLGPAFDPADRAVPAVPAEPPPKRTGQLLYIEDNAVNVLLVEELVRSLSGLQITSETTGTEGVARAAALLPDLILIDMQLPDFDGFEVLRRLRAEPLTAAIPCIALSANAMPEDIASALAAGFKDYWTKPIRFKPFLEALKRLFPQA